MATERYQELEREFKVIRDERGVAQNTAVRIGTAFLDLLRYCMSGEFDEIIFNKVLNKPTFMKGLITLGTIVLGDYIEGLKGGIITEEAFAELKDLWVREHIKVGDGTVHKDEAGHELPALEVKGDSIFSGDLSTPEFQSGFLGGLGWAIQKKEYVNSFGQIEYKYTLEIDNAVIRNTLRVFELIISQLLGENDNRIFAAMMEVHHYDPETGKVWLSTNGGRWFMNFRKGDCIMVQQYQGENDVVSGGDGNIIKTYELLVTDVGVGGETDEDGNRLDWLTFTNFTTQMTGDGGKVFTPEDLIKEFDTFTRVDNLTDPERKGLMTIMTVGNNTPYMDVGYGLKTDPKNYLKTRIGNLEGIRNDIFGWLEGFGIYTTNYYGIGHFINAQTGENVQARQEMTLQRFHSFYQETTYNISDEDNFLTNGFFQKELESWTRCEADGTPVADEPDSQLLGTVEESGEAMMPLMINGQMLSVANRRVADITDMDGIKVLHLLGMGVSQAFSDIKPKGTHKEMESDSQESTEVVDVDDFMYMGIRILPVTHGTLYAKFIKADGSWTGWETELEDSFDWLLWQYREIEANRWEWEGSGRFVLSYTGECYIRFVALTTDAVANARVDYQTHIEQTSRRITLQAIKTDAQHQTAMAEIQLQHDAVMNVVTTNKSTSDTMLSTILGITVNEDGTYSIPESLLGENMATWRINTNSHIIDLAAHWDENDQLIGYATQELTWNHISSEVADGIVAAKGYTDELKGIINTDVLKDASGNFGYATWKTQTDAAIASIAGKWDDNGQLIGYSSRTQTADFIREVIAGTATSQNFKEWGDAGTDLINGFKDFKDTWDTALSDGTIDAEERGRLNALKTTLQERFETAVAEYRKIKANSLIDGSTELTALDAAHNKLAGEHKDGSYFQMLKAFNELPDGDIKSTDQAVINLDAAIQTCIADLKAFCEAMAAAGVKADSELLTKVNAVTREFETYQENLDNKIKEKYPDSTFVSWVSDTAVSSMQVKALLNAEGQLKAYSNRTQTADFIREVIAGTATSQAYKEWGNAGTSLINGFKNFKDTWDTALSDGTIDAEERGRLNALKTTLQENFETAVAEYRKIKANSLITDSTELTTLNNAHDKLAGEHKDGSYFQMLKAFRELPDGDIKSTDQAVINLDAAIQTCIADLKAFCEAMAAAGVKADSELLTKVNAVTREFETYQENLDNKIKEKYPDSTFISWVSDTMVSSVQVKGLLNEEGELKGLSALKQTVDDISSAVVGIAGANNIADILDKIGNQSQVTIGGLSGEIEEAYGLASEAKDSAGTSATWISQNKKRISLISDQFDEEGNLTNTSGLVTSVGSGEGSFSFLFSAALKEDGTVMKKADMGTYVQKDGQNYITGAFINANRINFHAQVVEVTNEDDQITFQLDKNGNLKVMGTIEGGQIINNIDVGSDGTNKMEIYCNERTSGLVSYHSGIRGWDNNGNKVLDLGFVEFGTNKLIASLDFGHAYYRGSGFSINDGTYRLDVGFANNKIWITSNYAAWPVGDPATLGISKGQLYVDDRGFVKIYNK